VIEFKKTIDGIIKYINSELLDGMNDVQRFAARVLLSRIINNEERIKNFFANNGFVRALAVVDSNGMVDVEGIARDIKREIEKNGKIAIEIPFFGKYTFTPLDVDKLYSTIIGGQSANENN
jgi:hypothetical protein